MTRIEISRVQSAGLELVDQVNALIPQLSARSPPLTLDTLGELLAAPGHTLYMAWRDGHAVGTLFLLLFRCPTGVRAFIEDVVVDAGARRTGVAEALTRAAIAQAKAAGARSIDLTCRPERQAAHQLYRKLGFQVRDTHFHRLDLA